MSPIRPLQNCLADHGDADSPLKGVFERTRSALTCDRTVRNHIDWSIGYALFAVSEGLSRIGCHSFSAQVRSDSQTLLSGQSGQDPVHDYLNSAYRVSLGLADMHLPRKHLRPIDLLAKRDSLSRLEGYKVDRLRHVSRILDPTYPADCLPAWNYTGYEEALESVALRSLTDSLASCSPELLAKTIKRAVSQNDSRVLTAFFELLVDNPDLPERDALIAVALPRLSTELQAKALLVCSTFDNKGFCDQLFGIILSGISQTTPSNNDVDYIDVLSNTVRALYRLRKRKEICLLLTAYERLLSPSTSFLSLVHSAALDLVGENTVMSRLFDKVFAELEALPMSLESETSRGPTAGFARQLSFAATHASVDSALQQLSRMTSLIPLAKDSYSTNTHFSLSLIHSVESAVLGLTDTYVTQFGTSDGTLESGYYALECFDAATSARLSPAGPISERALEC
jgi:hypothetical protein